MNDTNKMHTKKKQQQSQSQTEIWLRLWQRKERTPSNAYTNSKHASSENKWRSRSSISTKNNVLCVCVWIAKKKKRKEKTKCVPKHKCLNDMPLTSYGKPTSTLYGLHIVYLPCTIAHTHYVPNFPFYRLKNKSQTHIERHRCTQAFSLYLCRLLSVQVPVYIVFFFPIRIP